MQIGFLGILTIIFVVCKLAGVIAWSWIWVLAPMWIGTVALLAFFVATVLLAAWAAQK